MTLASKAKLVKNFRVLGDEEVDEDIMTDSDEPVEPADGELTDTDLVFGRVEEVVDEDEVVILSFEHVDEDEKRLKCWSILSTFMLSSWTGGCGSGGGGAGRFVCGDDVT